MCSSRLYCIVRVTSILNFFGCINLRCINKHHKGAMSDHIESIKKGFLVLLSVLDGKGRAIIYGEPTLAKGEVDKVVSLMLGV